LLIKRSSTALVFEIVADDAMKDYPNLLRTWNDFLASPTLMPTGLLELLAKDQFIDALWNDDVRLRVCQA
jgi:hypothetical protein